VQDSVVSLTTLILRSVSAAHAPELAASTEGREYLFRHLDAKRRWAEKLALAMAHFDARQRFALLLIELHERLQRDGHSATRRFHLPLTQPQIGS
jgi:hypothetical protein